MTINSAIEYTRDEMIQHKSTIIFDLDFIPADPEALGNFIISAACATDVDGTPGFEYKGDFLWFHIANISSITANGKTMTLVIRYYDTAAELQDAFDAADILATSLNIGSLSALDAIKAIFLWIARNCAYDATSRIGGGYQRNSMYDVLNVNKAVCQGIANTVYYMINRYVTAGCRMIQGHELYRRQLYKHCYNLVNYNGTWYYLDATAAVHAYEDDPTISDNDLLAWCLKSGADIEASGRTNYLVLPNHLRSEWRANIQPIATVSAI